MRYYDFKLEGAPNGGWSTQLASGGYDFAAPLFELDISIGAADQHGTLGNCNTELERRQDAVKAEVANEARTRAEAVEQGVCAVIGGAAQKRREIDDELSSFEITFDILLGKNSDAQRAIVECEAALAAAAVKGVVAEEVSPLLLLHARLRKCGLVAEIRIARAAIFRTIWPLP